MKCHLGASVYQVHRNQAQNLVVNGIICPHLECKAVIKCHFNAWLSSQKHLTRVTVSSRAHNSKKPTREPGWHTAVCNYYHSSSMTQRGVLLSASLWLKHQILSLCQCHTRFQEQVSLEPNTWQDIQRDTRHFLFQVHTFIFFGFVAEYFLSSIHRLYATMDEIYRSVKSSPKKSKKNKLLAFCCLASRGRQTWLQKDSQ